MYHQRIFFQCTRQSLSVGTTDSSNEHMKILANKGFNGDPIENTISLNINIPNECEKNVFYA